jgi:hypothetical protein
VAAPEELRKTAVETGFVLVNFMEESSAPEGPYPGPLPQSGCGATAVPAPACLVQVLVLTPRPGNARPLPRATGTEIAHSRILARGDTEQLWGWNSPAGRKRRTTWRG